MCPLTKSIGGLPDTQAPPGGEFRPNEGGQCGRKIARMPGFYARNVHFLPVHMDKHYFHQVVDYKGLNCVHVHMPLDWVGGGILVHGVAPLHHAIEAFSEGRAGMLTGALLNGLAGVVAGAVVLAVVSLAAKVWRAIRG